MANQCQLPWQPHSGQALLYVEFAEVKSLTVTEVLEVLESLGYEPKLRYRDTVAEGTKLYALLLEEQLDPSYIFPDTHWLDESMALYEAFQPNENAIHCVRGLPAPVMAVAA